jgi:hypothetical protein
MILLYICVTWSWRIYDCSIYVLINWVWQHLNKIELLRGKIELSLKLQGQCLMNKISWVIFGWMQSTRHVMPSITSTYTRSWTRRRTSFYLVKSLTCLTLEFFEVSASFLTRSSKTLSLFLKLMKALFLVMPQILMAIVSLRKPPVVLKLHVMWHLMNLMAPKRSKLILL